MTTVVEFTEMLGELLLAEGLGEAAFTATSFPDAGVLTRNDGLVVQFRNGDVFQLTIVQRASSPVPEPTGDATYDVTSHAVVTGGAS